MMDNITIQLQKKTEEEVKEWDLKILEEVEIKLDRVEFKLGKSTKLF